MTGEDEKDLFSLEHLGTWVLRLKCAHVSILFIYFPSSWEAMQPPSGGRRRATAAARAAAPAPAAAASADPAGQARAGRRRRRRAPPVRRRAAFPVPGPALAAGQVLAAPLLLVIAVVALVIVAGPGRLSGTGLLRGGGGGGLDGYGDGDGDGDGGNEGPTLPPAPKQFGVPSPGGRYLWSDPALLPPLPGQKDLIGAALRGRRGRGARKMQREGAAFRVRHRGSPPQPWEAEADDDRTGTPYANGGAGGTGEGGGEGGGHVNHGRGITGGSSPRVDYTSLEYRYPDVLREPPAGGGYPLLETLGTLMERWPQDNLDAPPQPLVERLLHFDYTDPGQMEMALRFREAELPFKVYNVPEVVEAGRKWTDEYLASHFDAGGAAKRRRKIADRGSDPDEVRRFREEKAEAVPGTNGHCQEAKGNFFSFFQPIHWDLSSLGPPPTLDNDWTFSEWARHARYADKVGLNETDRHYYWQAGVPPKERNQPRDSWTFVSRDLPSFSNPEPTFFGFNPEMQKGIQCRFGERGVTAATHYDAGRNMIAMVAGAKRYVLGPPRACPELGIVAAREHPVFRHSLLNFGYLNVLDSDDPEARSMPPEERSWLEIARNSMAVETVLKAGEVLYVPSHWFHYITSLQKSAQCNTRSGRETKGTAEFGGFADVVDCVGEGA